MKSVFNKSAEVAQQWATGHPGARTGSNTWSKGDDLFSYGTCIASIVDKHTALVTRTQYSSGTSKVVGEARGAAFRAGRAVFLVLDVRPKIGADHLNNLNDYSSRIEAKCVQIERARDWLSARSHRNEAMQLVAEAYLYATVFDVLWSHQGRNPMMVRCAKGNPTDDA